jgi:hypothetical protein
MGLSHVQTGQGEGAAEQEGGESGAGAGESDHGWRSFFL